MKNTKKILSVLLAVVLLVSVLPMGAMALYSGGGENNHRTAYLDLSNFFDFELSSIPLSYVLENATDSSGNTLEIDGSIAAYSVRPYAYDEEGADVFRLLEEGDTLDLSKSYRYSSSGCLRFVVGTPDQLDRNNQFIDVRLTYYTGDMFTPSARTPEGAELQVANYYEGYSTSRTGQVRNHYQLDVMPGAGWTEGQPIRVSLTPYPEFLDRGYTLKVYLGNYTELAEIPAEATEITDDLLDEKTGYLMDDSRYSFNATFVWSNGETTEVLPAYIGAYEASVGLDSYMDLYYQTGTSSWSSAVYSRNHVSGTDENGQYFSYYVTTLKAGLSVNADYMVSIDYHDYDGSYKPEKVTKAVIGAYDSLEAAANAEDVKDQIFGNAYLGEGLTWNFGANGPLTVTAFDEYGNVLQETYRVVERAAEPEPEEEVILSSDTYFHAYDAYDPVYSVSCDTYYVEREDDSYYPRYQTLFVVDYSGDPIRGAELIPDFSSAAKTVYASYDGGGAVPQRSGESRVPVTYGKAIHYSAAAENGKDLGDFYLTFVTQAEGSRLFVNAATNSEHLDEETGLPTRVIYLDSSRDFRHDILFANFGTEEMTGLQVSLSPDATGVRLDDFWTIREDSVGTLPPFDGGVDDNYGKIRLVPVDQEGFSAISGTLTISADGNDPVTILLSGMAGQPRIVTTTLAPGAVKYVPYASVIQTNYIGDVTDAIEFSIVDGALPAGMVVKPNGEVYGVPLEAGTFTFTVQAAFKEDESIFDSRTYVLVVAENTDENVDNATDEGYELIDRIPYYIEPSDQLFHSEGEIVEFIDAFLDGRKLVRDAEYLLEEGSTKITILDETLSGESAGTHTLSAEFRIGGSENGELRRAAQNFVLGEGEGTDWSDDEDDYEDEEEEAAEEKEEPKQNETETPARAFSFTDVQPGSWYYDDVKWVYDAYLMNGVSDTEFAPNGVVDAATIVTVLARTIGVDLTQYANSEEVNLPQDQWYSAAANWALQTGLIDDSFERNKPFERGQMAELLCNYFRYLGIDCTVPVPAAEFTDAGQMSPKELDAFQVLYKYGIFKGVGNNTMDVHGSTSRAQLAALMHRIKTFIDSRF